MKLPKPNMSAVTPRSVYMKKVLSLVLCITISFSLIFSLCSCSNSRDAGRKDINKISVVTTIFPYYDFVREIADDKVDIKLLLSPGNEPHTYEPSPSDIVAIENCDLFIYNGGESDQWVNNILKTLDNKSLKALRMMVFVKTFSAEEHTDEYADCEEGEMCDIEEHNHSDNAYDYEENDNFHEGHHHEVDEHIWTSLKNAVTLSEKIAECLVELDSKNAEFYKENKDKFTSELKTMDEEITQITKSSKRDTLIFGDRFPFLYFVTDYNLKYECAFPGCSSETEPSISTVTHLIDYVRKFDIPTVFHLEFSNGNIANLISEDTNAEVRRFSSCHNVTKDEFSSGCTYISLMEDNIKVLKEALS